MCSEMWNIVKSDEWLNLHPEDGKQGWSSGSKHSIESRIKMKGKKRSEESCAKNEICKEKYFN